MGTTTKDKLGLLGTTTELNTAIHEGKAYSLDKDGTIALESSISLLGRVSDKEIHFHSFGGNFQKGKIRISLYEAPTITADGTPITAQTNLNRNFADTSNMLLFDTPTVSDNGLKISGTFVPITGSGANTESSSPSVAGGRVLKKNTDYLIVVENLDNASCAYGINFIWAEHDESANA